MNSDLIVWGELVSELAAGRIPTRADSADARPFQQALSSIFCGSRVRKQWLEVFIRRVNDQSWGKFTIQAVAWNDFPIPPIKGPAQPMKLMYTETGEETFFFFGPYRDPFTIVQTDGTIVRGQVNS